MKIILLGAARQLAHALKSALANHEVLPWTRTAVDITDEARLRDQVTVAAPDAVVNATAYNLVDQAEKESEAAFAVNAFAARNLARICAEVGCTLLHFSTDYVF